MEATRSYRDVADALREKIRSGEHQSGNLLPTERELQTAYGVSRSTVRRALQNLAESGWAEIRPNRGAVGILGRSTPASTFIGFVDDAGCVHQSLFFRLSLALESHGLHLAMVDSRGRGTEGAIELCAERGFGAAIVWSKTSTPQVERIVASRLPVVAVDHGINGLACDVVKARMYDGAREVVRHLVALGRRRIAITGWLDALDTTQERYAGYMHGLYEAGIQPQARNFVFHSPHADGPDLDLLRYRLGQTDRPDAVFATSDVHIAEIAATIESAGLRIPDDVALVGAGNDVQFVHRGLGLTTLSIDWTSAADEIGRRVVRRLVEPHAAPVEALIPVHLVVRGSCGAPPEAWEDAPYFPSRLRDSSGSPFASVPPMSVGLLSTTQ